MEKVVKTQPNILVCCSEQRRGNLAGDLKVNADRINNHVNGKYLHRYRPLNNLCHHRLRFLLV